MRRVNLEGFYARPMGRYSGAVTKIGFGIPGPGTCPTQSQIDELLDHTRDEDPKVRRLALKHLCPCRVRRDRPDVWDRVFEMADDSDAGVRMDVVHAMTDGSPRDLADRVRHQLEGMRRDPDRLVRRYVSRTLAAQRRTGRINVN